MDKVEAMKTLKDFHDKSALFSVRTALETLHPELKESEDEKIRKFLIKWIQDNYYHGTTEIPTKTLIAWLERQGGEKSSIEMITPEESLGIDSETYNKIVDECIYGEQKPINKIEAKFKVDDWVVDNCGYVWKTEGILNQFYILEGVEGGESRPTIEWVNKTFHFWTIQDAKDGDVLWHSDTASHGTFIFKQIRYDGKVLCYCDYDSEDHFCTGEHHTCCWSSDKCIKPATKEQRDLLFSKMNEAGYEWDFKKKELKKIEDEHQLKE